MNIHHATASHLSTEHDDFATMLDIISAHTFDDETQAMAELLPHVEVFRPYAATIEKRAERYIQEIRAAGVHGGVEQFISQFGLKEKEAVGLLCLAEALLRIPDSKTADELIFDKLSGAQWKKFLKEQSSFSLHARAWGLMISTRFTELQKSKNLIEHSLHELSEPVIRQALKAAMQLLGKEFVAGKNIDAALTNTKGQRKKGYMFSFDMLGEAARTEAQAEHYTNRYLDALEKIAAHNADGDQPKLYSRTNISVKLSALYSRYDYLQQEAVMDVLYGRLKRICLKAKEYRVSVSIDAEESYRLDSELPLFAKLITDKDFAGFDGLGFVLQAYQKRALHVIDFLSALAEKHGKQIPVRLVKGAYWDSEIKWAQMEGAAGYPVFTRKSHTDVSFLACAARLLERTDLFFPQFATHNALTAAAIITLAEEKGKQSAYEFQRLFGMGDAFYDQMISRRPCRIYAPVGPFKELLPYLIRRLMENGANSNFVNQLLDKKQEITTLLKNPIDESLEKLPLKEYKIRLPQQIFDDRENSAGYSLGSRQHVALLQQMREPYLSRQYEAVSMVGGKTLRSGDTVTITSPANHQDVIGAVNMADNAILEQALHQAPKGQAAWAEVPLGERAAILEKVAEEIKAHEGEFYALLAREAGKTIADAIAEVREAIDFCRYYAAQARLLAEPQQCQSYTGEEDILMYHPRGVIACISPWNFPLAIYVGQIAAALVAGNAIIAKPAESTSLIAYRMAELFYASGIPQDALFFTPAAGKVFGETVIASNVIAGVAFTGSTTTAQWINRTLAARDNAPIARLIAETGGQNCMLVDSSALLEQATDDIIMSAFGSAGQRCSALRVLFVQENIADELIEMVRGKMEQLRIGNPLNFSIDTGPVISERAKDGLEAHIYQMQHKGKLVYRPALPDTCKEGYFVAPALLEIPEIGILEKEQFGPVLHVVRYQASKLDDTIAEINSTGYGLTFGIHSRIEERIAYITSRIRAGNLYINRNMIGAIVGVQPFGGMGLSGTGPKAGGPNYVKAFMEEKVVTNNTTAIGGNLELLG